MVSEQAKFDTSHIPFTERDIKKYLDDSIRYWRRQRDEKGEKAEMAVYYIDCLQSTRTSLFGELLD